MNIVKWLSKIKLLRDRVLKLFRTHKEPITVGEGGCRFVEDQWDQSGYYLELSNASRQLPDYGFVRIDVDHVPWKPGGKRILVTFYHQDDGNAPASS